MNDKILEELARRKKTERSVSREAGLSSGTINSWLNNPDTVPEPENVRKVAKYFGWDVDEALEWAGHREPRAIREARVPYTELLRRAEQEAPIAIPVYEQIVHAGRGGVAMDYTYMPPEQVRNRRLAAAYTYGDCMEPAVLDGSLIVVDLDASPEINDIVVVLVDSEDVVVRRLTSKSNGTVTLTCDNPAYPPTDVEGSKIIGVVIQSTRQYRR